MIEKHICTLVQISKGLYAYNETIHSVVATTVPSLVIIRQMVHYVLSGQC